MLESGTCEVLTETVAVLLMSEPLTLAVLASLFLDPGPSALIVSGARRQPQAAEGHRYHNHFTRLQARGC
jgi:hypothetical protein